MWPATRPAKRAELVGPELVEQRGDVLDGIATLRSERSTERP
jgi:hypothetical protein